MKHNTIRAVVVASASAGIVAAAAIVSAALPTHATTTHTAVAANHSAVLASAPLSVPHGKITIIPRSQNGSGCPVGTASIEPSADNTSFTVTYPAFVASAGGDADPTDARKNCQLVVQVDYPGGFTFAVARADYSGKAHLSDGGSAKEITTYYFQGESAQTSVEHNFTGPSDGPWTVSDVTPVESLVWAPCGKTRLFSINEELRATKGTDENVKNSIQLVQSKNSVQTLLHLVWKRC